MSTNPISPIILSTLLSLAVLAGIPACSDERASPRLDDRAAAKSESVDEDADSWVASDEPADEWPEASEAIEDAPAAMLQEMMDAAAADLAFTEEEGADAWEVGESAGYADPGDVGGAYEYATPWGSGERNAAGDWSHYSDAAGGAVGGTANGCIYAGDWSNC